MKVYDHTDTDHAIREAVILLSEILVKDKDIESTSHAEAEETLSLMQAKAPITFDNAWLVDRLTQLKIDIRANVDGIKY